MKKCLLATGALMIAFAAGTMLAPGLTGQEKGGKNGPAGPGLTLNSPDFTDGGIIPTSSPRQTRCQSLLSWNGPTSRLA